MKVLIVPMSVWNLMLNVTVTSPSENNGVIWPYVILAPVEIVIASYMIVSGGA